MAGASYFQRIMGHGQRGRLSPQPMQPLHPLLRRWETASTSLPPDSEAAISGMEIVPATGIFAVPQNAPPSRLILPSLPASAPPDKTGVADENTTIMPLSNTVPATSQGNAGTVRREPFSPADFTSVPANPELSDRKLKSSEVAALPEPVPAPSMLTESARTRTDSRTPRSRLTPAPKAEAPLPPAAPIQRLAGAERDRKTTAAPTPTVHIGSVEIRITPAPPPVPMTPPRPSAAPAGSLARDFGSPLGLRQS